VYNKRQRPDKLQCSKFEISNPLTLPLSPGGEGKGEERSLEIDTWGLFGACDLEFGI